MTPPRVFVESYHGTYQQAHAAFREAAARHGAAGYLPFVFLGRDRGTLTVTYTYVGPPPA